MEMAVPEEAVESEEDHDIEPSEDSTNIETNEQESENISEVNHE